MSARETLNNTILPKLKSTTIRERTEGLSSIRTIFASNRVVEHFYVKKDGKPDPLGWLVVFQGLFDTLSKEKGLATTKVVGKAGSTVTATRRLAEAAAVVRWLTEKTAHLINKTVLKALFEHLLQTMVHQRELLMPVALDYIKALKALLSHSPNLQHTDPATWIRIVEMGFNVVLGDPIRKTFADDYNVEEDSERERSATSSTRADDMVIDEDDTEMMEDDPASPATSKKRRRSPTPRPSKQTIKPSQRARSASHQIAVSLEQIEFNSVLSILLQATSAPFLSDEDLPSSILNRLLRFLELYPHDTSLHHDYLLALSATLSHVSLNRKRDVVKFARSAWIPLVGLWGTKNKGLKEGLVTVLCVLFPYLTSPPDGVNPYPGPESVWGEGVAKLWHLLDGEAGRRWGMDLLSLDALRLQLIDTDPVDNDKAFVASTFRAGVNFNAEQALAWSVLELQADCAEKVLLTSYSSP